jgi:selenocysteine lyase/cysteine desulfurase
MPLMRRLGVVGTVRVSFSVHTTPGEIEFLAKALSNLNLML